MSLEQKKDAMILFSIVFMPVLLIIVFYQYFVSHDTTFIYIAIAAVILIIVVGFARYRDILDYAKTLLEKWK